MIIDRANNRASMTGEYYWPIDPPTADEPEGTVFWGFSIVVLEFEEFKSALSRYASTLGKDGRR